ncbi:MAG: CBS domain-containing protein [Dehalococcoidia bacterium]|nr:MAG: CBS domain-containing protein [Dehalococcoidia bacterium]
MKKLYRKLLAELRQIASSFSIAYFRKWSPAAVLIGIAAGVASMAFSSAMTWATKLSLGLGAEFTPPAPARVANEDILPIPQDLLRATTTVERVMSTNLVVIHPEKTLEWPLELMVAKGVAVLPVVDKKNATRLPSLVTRRSVIQAYESEAKKIMAEVHYP